VPATPTCHAIAQKATAEALREGGTERNGREKDSKPFLKDCHVVSLLAMTAGVLPVPSACATIAVSDGGGSVVKTGRTPPWYSASPELAEGCLRGEKRLYVKILCTWGF